MSKKNQEEKVFSTEIPASDLTAPKGVKEISIAGETYEVVDGIVTVPTSLAGELVESHGFKFAE